MPSVDVVWHGNCRDPQVRYRLLSYLHRLASLSDKYLRRGEGPCLSVVDEDYTAPPRANIEIIDHDISGRILISTAIAPHPERLVVRARESGLPVVEAEGETQIVLDRVRLRGLDFKLFDPVAARPNAARMSFVFLECPEYHFLDGRFVEIVGDDGEPGGANMLRRGTIYLASPGIHLHDYLDEWTDCLFSWIRFFLIGDFWWKRGEELQGYTDYRGVFEQLQTERGRASAEEATFDAVLGTLSQHAEHRLCEVQSIAKA